MTAPAAATDHAWLPRATCDSTCVGVGPASPRWLVVLRVTLRVMLALLLLLVAPLALVPGPSQMRVRRFCCGMVLRVFGVRISVSGAPIRNLRGVLVVGPHMSWLDVFAVGAVLPGWYVARADMFGELTARLLKIIPIDRASLRRLPAVVDSVAERLSAGETVVAFPEGTTWCGVACGSFYPAMFQAAIDAGRPVQPLRLTYHHVDGLISTAPAFVGDDALGAAMGRMLAQRRTLAHVHVESLQLPGTDRRALARRSQLAVGVGVAQRPGQRHVLVA
ncbi:lysophospholipid acyltransferase family protein [Mycobacterium montefiorense]|uniref:lysophospholipid acyltransferase family protein n=1 Tax=Mycobacterium montefiorense TaxID=154654 RepID=UPI0021F2B97D|nr:lysophospholipid acyltransferase family protein [Mycobacterium montefiorense]MCV7427708.1 1-acyl-sn-glycerol-3-phosphate acyltransferase [Mycobacterium montefiorense]GLE50578.1 1-acyl-sn-glycerol-3-phosphate acyltransferase [Mycobacterium montefiorense]